jgi:hypothetical protein
MTTTWLSLHVLHYSVLLSWRGEEFPLPVKEDSKVEAIQEHVAENYPLFGMPTEDAIGQLQRQNPSVSRTVRCSRYHDVSGKWPFLNRTYRCKMGIIFVLISLKLLVDFFPVFGHFFPCIILALKSIIVMSCQLHVGRALLIGDAAHSTGGTLGQVDIIWHTE